MKSEPLDELVEHGYADHDGVRLHYAHLGRGPLVMLLHGFPEFWYTWRAQMPALAQHYHTVALDLRGYNLSDKPQGATNYAMPQLVGDILAVIRQLGQDRAIIVGHDWGAAIAWQVAMHVPAVVERLVILNMPHPRGLARELARNPAQVQASAYAHAFQQECAAQSLDIAPYLAHLQDAEDRARYATAWRHSDPAAVLAYYQQNYPRPPYQEDRSPVIPVRVPVMQMHGLRDTALLPATLDGTWAWVAARWTLVTIPEAGHFVQHDAAATVTQTLLTWLAESASH
jgi:epoxide hydrolase 4